MAADPKTAIGNVEPGEVRRIGLSHAVVLVPREPKVVDVDANRRLIEQIDRRLESLAKERTKLEAQRAELAATVTTFDSLPIERLDGDPDVPQPGRDRTPPDAPPEEAAPVDAAPAPSDGRQPRPRSNA